MNTQESKKIFSRKIIIASIIILVVLSITLIILDFANIISVGNVIRNAIIFALFAGIAYPIKIWMKDITTPKSEKPHEE
jgi:hypothetical protein